MSTWFCKQTLLTGVGIFTLLISNYPAISCPLSTVVKISNSQNLNINNSMTQKILTFQGLLTYEPLPPGKSVRAYKGEEFFIKTNSMNPERIVLRSSENVSVADLESFHNQQVEITAVYFAGIRPSKNEVACPLDFDGQCMVQGEGYQVLSITPLKFKQQ
ncbi:MAG TPA: hypothetical protein VK203_31105 [Nostocaceae cyanobacterium]|nr:hypothetical protein [Nostocaceae cyanobacterium]